MTVGMKGTVEKRLKRSKQRMRKEPLNKTRMVDTLKDYSCESSIHGIQYLGNRKHSTCGRGFWVITVCIALICTLVQVSNIWYQWVDDPVVTTLSTISLPVEEIDFPAVTLCPQGSTEDIIDNVLYHQFQEWLLHRIDDNGKETRKKRLVEETNACECHLTDQGNVTVDILQCCFRLFLDETFYGVYPNNPTKMVTLLNTEDPDNAMEMKSVVLGGEEPICDESDKLEVLNNMNEKLHRTCPQPFQKYNESFCIKNSDQEMSYNEAFSYCKELGGADIFFLGSFEAHKTLDTIIGKPIHKKELRFLGYRMKKRS